MRMANLSMIVNYCDLAIMGEPLHPFICSLKLTLCLSSFNYTALLLYDMAITFSDEYQHMWKGKKTGVTILFLANRYLMLLQYILAPVTDCIRFYDNTVSFTRINVSN